MCTIPHLKYTVPSQWPKDLSGFRSPHNSTENGLIAGDDIASGAFQTQSIYDFSICNTSMPSRVSQKKQKSEFWYATNPTGFHKLDEPPKIFSAL